MPKAGIAIARFGVRLAFFAAAVFLVLGGPLPGKLVELAQRAGFDVQAMPRIVPQLSPLAALSESLAQRTWYLAFYWLIAPCVIAAAGLWKGRLFCRWACPAGSVFSVSAAITSKARVKTFRIIRVPLAAIIFWAIIGSALVGVTLFLPLDPLSSFNRITARTAGWAAWIPGAVLPAFLLIGIFQPYAWCAWICPLGYFFDLLKNLRTKPQQTFSRQRRQIIAGLAIGIPVAAVWKKFRIARPSKAFMPPGSVSTEHFASACTRCYACVGVCPGNIIKINSSPAELDRLFLPTLDYNAGQKVCDEFCNECTKVCPVGAIKPMKLEDKQDTQIAVGVIRKKDCIAWAKNEVCAVCDEYCPYGAIDITYAPEDKYHDVALPVINPDRCRGCGYCRKHCASPAPDLAIDMVPVDVQKTIHDSYRARNKLQHHDDAEILHY